MKVVRNYIMCRKTSKNETSREMYSEIRETHFFYFFLTTSDFEYSGYITVLTFVLVFIIFFLLLLALENIANKKLQFKIVYSMV